MQKQLCDCKQLTIYSLLQRATSTGQKPAISENMVVFSI